VDIKISDTLVDYPDALAAMEARVAGIIDGSTDEQLWLLEHPPLYTAGTSANDSDLLTPGRFPVYQTGRGGEYTYHGPGQRVGYVMIDLKRRNPDIRDYIINLEQWIINSLQHFDIKAERREGRIGLWVAHKGPNGPTESKIAAIGVRVRKWVTFHGISLNIDPNLSHFAGIVPCGINTFGVTSMEALNVPASRENIDSALINEFKRIFTP